MTLVYDTQKSMAFREDYYYVCYESCTLNLNFYNRNRNTVCLNSIVHFYRVSYNISMDILAIQSVANKWHSGTFDTFKSNLTLQFYKLQDVHE